VQHDSVPDCGTFPIRRAVLAMVPTARTERPSMNDLYDGLSERGRRIFGQIEKARSEGFDSKDYAQRITGCTKPWIGGSRIHRNDNPPNMDQVMAAVIAARGK
jgi:hypothetical protein